MLGRVEGLVACFLLAGAAGGLVAPGAGAVLGPAAPPAGPDVRAAPDALADGTRLALGAPFAGDPAGGWFAAGEPANAPEASSATRPALAATAAPAAMTAARRRFPPGWFPHGWPA